MSSFVSIYKVTNTSNGLIYIGQTAQLLERRWKRHLYDALSKNKPQAFYQAIRQFGAGSFVIERIAEASDQKWGDYLETLYILIHNSTNSEIGYNRALGGRSGRHLPEVKVKIGENSRNWWQDPENKKRASESRKGLLVGERNPMFGRHEERQPHSKETKELLSKLAKERFSDPEYKERMSEANTGKHHTEDGRANISAALKGNQYRKGIPHDEETKARITASLKATWARKRSSAAKLVLA